MSFISNIGSRLLGSQMHAAQLQRDVSTAVAAKVQDVAEAHGEAAISLLEAAVQVAQSSSPEAASSAGRLDLMA